MADEDVQSAIDKLISSGQTQSENIDKLTDSMVILVQAVRMRPTKLQTFGIAGALNLVTLAVVAIMMVFMINTAGDTKSIVDFVVNCSTPGPTHTCYAQIQANNQVNRRVISLRSEQLRLQDQIEVSKATNNDPAVAKNQELLANINDQLRKLGETP